MSRFRRHSSPKWPPIISIFRKTSKKSQGVGRNRPVSACLLRVGSLSHAINIRPLGPLTKNLWRIEFFGNFRQFRWWNSETRFSSFKHFWQVKIGTSMVLYPDFVALKPLSDLTSVTREFCPQSDPLVFGLNWPNFQRIIIRPGNCPESSSCAW